MFIAIASTNLSLGKRPERSHSVIQDCRNKVKHEEKWKTTLIKILQNPRIHNYLSLTDEWIKKPWCIYTMECYLAIKIKKILLFA